MLEKKKDSPSGLPNMTSISQPDMNVNLYSA